VKKQSSAVLKGVIASLKTGFGKNCPEPCRWKRLFVTEFDIFQTDSK